MKFSIVIPVYNGEKTISKTVNNILNTNLSDYEVVIVDDGSTDKTSEICSGLILDHPEVCYYKKINSGVSETRNYGVNVAKGEYILFVDADDLLLPFDLEKIQKSMSNQADIIMFGMTFSYIWKNKTVREEKMIYETDEIFNIIDISSKFLDLFKSNYLSPVWNKFIRKSILCDNKIEFNKNLTNYEDLEYTLRVLAKSKTISVISDSYYLYKNVYDKDHTVTRIAEIDDIMSNTDLIASAFFDLDKEIHLKTSKHLDNIYQVVLAIYVEIFKFKLHSLKYKEIDKECIRFMEDFYVNICLNKIPEINQNEFINKIKNKKCMSIYLNHCYKTLRHKFANRVKLMIYLLKR